MERLRGTTAPSGPGLPTGGMGSPAKAAVGAYGALAADGYHLWRGPSGWGEGESYLPGGLCLWSVSEGWQAPSAPLQQRAEKGSRARALVGASGAPAGDGSPQRPEPTGLGDGASSPGGGRLLWSAYGEGLPPSAQAYQLGGRGVLLMRRSVPMDRLRGTAAPTGPGPLAGGNGSPPPSAVASYGAAATRR